MKSKTKIPAVVTAYLKRAPRVPGYRLLKPTERARAGDVWYYLRDRDGPRTAITLNDGWLSCTLRFPEDAETGFIRIGRTLLEARRDGIWGKGGLYTAADFTGVIYRPTSKK